jgi:hypothetical protein
MIGICTSAAERHVTCSVSAEVYLPSASALMISSTCSAFATKLHLVSIVGQLTWSCSLHRAVLQVDVRSPTAAALVWGVSADVEALAWNPGSPTCFLVSSEDGIVAAFDARGGAGGPQCWQQVLAGS